MELPGEDLDCQLADAVAVLAHPGRLPVDLGEKGVHIRYVARHLHPKCGQLRPHKGRVTHDHVGSVSPQPCRQTRAGNEFLPFRVGKRQHGNARRHWQLLLLREKPSRPSEVHDFVPPGRHHEADPASAGSEGAPHSELEDGALIVGDMVNRRLAREKIDFYRAETRPVKVQRCLGRQLVRREDDPGDAARDQNVA